MRYLEDTPGTKRWSVIGLGTWQFGSREWGYGDGYASTEAGAIVRRALELGITVFDTAEIYGRGRSERILGAALGQRRDEVVIASKVFPLAPFSPVVQQRAVASAARLGVSTIDLYQVHFPNPLVSDATTMAGMRALRTVGLVDQVGVSNYSGARWEAAQTALGAPVLSDQVRYSLLDRRPEAAVLPRAQAARGLLIAYSPLAQGLLSGRYDADHRPADRMRRSSAAFSVENLARLAPLLRVLREVADAHDASPAQVALAWLVDHDRVLAIPGASSVAQLESNAAAAEIGLAADERAALDATSAAHRPVGAGRALVSAVRARRSAS